MFDFGAYWDGNATGARYAWLIKNGNRFGTFANPTAASTASNQPEINCQIIINAAAGDYFELKVEQNSGGNLILRPTFDRDVYFACAYLGA